MADAAYRATRQPSMGETILGNSFALGPGGKGSNQAVAAARCNADVSFITKLGKDAFAQMALDMYSVEGINANIEQISNILNTAPAESVPDDIFALCDYVTPNETEVEAYTGVTVVSIADAKQAGDVLLAKGVGTALITLGEKGVLLHSAEQSVHIQAFNAGDVVETTGAGDAFNGGFAAALAQGQNPEDAARFACAVAGLSVTRAGTAPSMPTRDEVEALLDYSGE